MSSQIAGKSIYILDKGEQGDDKHSTDKRYEKTCLFYEEWQKHGDAENSLKLFEVIQKYKQEQLMIAFCGHFSAGKSTMMNHLYKSAVVTDKSNSDKR